ncbi:MAG: 7-cyano-7-deazaguanine synthase [Planctomycetota bacterium]|nr:7-cyano-7-deazaguanine synthase [Planctomycetota bacterium]
MSKGGAAMGRPLAVALASGGMDSCVAAAWAAARYRLAMLHVNYGQRTEAKELECFRRLAAHFRAEKTLVADAPYLVRIGGSSLTDRSIPVPPDDRPGETPSTYVPFRNANLLAIATAWAETIGAARIVIGAVEQYQDEAAPCRNCASCRRREEAFREVGMPDPLLQQKRQRRLTQRRKDAKRKRGPREKQ